MWFACMPASALRYFTVNAANPPSAMGISPTLWGVMIDVTSASKAVWLGIEWNEYTLYFAGVAGVLMLTALTTIRLEEAKAARLNELFLDLVRHSPLRSWLRN